ncbi:hypothetical protein N0V93_007705 [Gnomoniopsis smithogilvyi]|uniref:TRIP4/RQT4 C2HC5-type zinc finger domain-containing protein n=1 Tax=Gnomoniopsis smithogilvyi TaxID=1191159 RepID=A0A9W8YNX1_9PEZI|nr:hypothetical protein N0V93_007705 [Gnomoniopsis smithogilvyi]
MSLNQLSMLLGLPDSDLTQILDYARTLSKAEAADHFKNLLGDSPQAVDFITTFNSRRQDPRPAPAPAPAPATSSLTASRSASDVDGVPRRPAKPKKKKAAIHTPAPRQVVETNPGPGVVYSKKQNDDDYIIGRGGSSTAASSKAPSRAATPKTSTPPPQKVNKPPPSATGSLVSDLLAPKQKPTPNPASRSSTPGPTSSKSNAAKTKVSITGGTPMHGASGAVADLDAAIRSLEITTNPSLSRGKGDDVTTRRCNCVGTRHPLQTAAPNCLKCGKVICLKEGLGPCTFCGNPILSPDEVQAMIRELKVERGREKQAADREAHKRPDVATAPRAFTKARTGYEDEAVSAAEAKAKEHRDKLLNFQAQNARRTTVRDEAADFDVAGAMAGTGSMWASAEERARELKRQQKLLREMEWNARPEYEKRQQVVSIDLVGGKVVKKFIAKERPPTPDEDQDDVDVGGVLAETSQNRGGAGGAFSMNPLLGGMIKPVYDLKGKSEALEGRKDRTTRWRRVQDDLSNNEDVILDGGIYGGKDGTSLGTSGDEPDCG